MRRSFRLLPLVALLAPALVLPAPTAFGEPTGATTVVERRIEAASLPAGAEVSQSVLEFGPGAWTPLHSHGGASYNTVLAGEVTLRINGVDRTFAAGEGWADQPCVPHQAGNPGTASARLVATFVTARDVPPTLVLDPPGRRPARPEPTVLAAQKLTAFALSGPVDIIHRVVSLQPGSTVPAQAQPGPSMVSVLLGSVSIEADGTTRSVSAGRGWTDPTGASLGYSAGGSVARVVATTFAPRSGATTATAQGAVVPGPVVP